MIEHTVTRRAILRAGAAAVALAALPMRILDAVAAPSSTTGTNTWTFSQWSGLVGSGFKSTLPDGSTLNLKLLSATNLMPAGSSTTSGPQDFSLTFSGPLSPSLGQATQTIYNRAVGSVQIFLVPGTTMSNAQHYGAIVYRV